MKQLGILFAVLFCLATLPAPAVIKRANRDLLRESQEAFEKRDFDHAIELLNQVIKDNPKLPNAYVLRGFARGAKGKYDEAVEDFTAAIDLNPDDEHLLLLRANANQQLKDWDAAIADFSEVIRRNPNDSDTLCSRGLSKNFKGDKAGAMEDFNRAVKVNPRSSAAFQFRGKAHADAGENKEALEDLNEALNINPKDPSAYISRAQFYLITDEPGKALEDFEQVLKLAPEFSGIYNDYAWTLATNPQDSVRNGKKAVELALKACELTNYEHGGTVDTLAAAYAEAGEWEKALKWQEKAIKLAEDSEPKDLPGMKERLQSFKDKKPFRENPKTLTAPAAR
jgi:tetratricopeptide (TPR) repeat protein